MIIRPLAPQDRDKIRWLIEQRGTFSEKEIQVAMGVVDEALRHPEREDYHVLCAVDGPDSLAGYICFGPIPMTDRCYDLYWIAVDERFARKGLGGKLLEHMEHELAGEKARRIYVDTSSTAAYEAARSFYEKHGYRAVCVLDHFYAESNHKMIFAKEVQSVVHPKGKVGCDRKDLRSNQ